MNSTKVQQLQLTQQNLQNIITQKQQIESQLAELDSAITELKTTEKAYKILGKIMVSTSKDQLYNDLNEKKEIFSVRLQNFTKQEETLQKSIDGLQKEVVEELKNNSDSSSQDEKND
jgi:prefoldin beta subunit